MLKFRDHILVAIICCVVFSYWIWVLTFKYTHFGYNDWDLAFFAQAMWNLCHGSLYVSLFDINFFSNHSNFIALILVPIYAIFMHPMVLLVLKVLSWIVGGYFIYLIARDKVGHQSALIVLLLFFFYPPNLFGILYEFDFEGLSVAFLVMMYYAFTKDRWRMFLLNACMLILIKENLSLILVTFGIYALFIKKDKFKWGLFPLILGVLSFIFLTQVFVPFMAGGRYVYGALYEQFGPTLPEAMIGMILNPDKVWQTVNTPLNINWFSSTLLQFGFLPFLSPITLWLISPILLQHLLSSASQEHTILYGYALTYAPFIFIAVINGLALIRQRYSSLMYVVVIVVIVSTSLFSFYQFLDRFQRNLIFRYSIPVEQIRQMIQLIPKEAGVIASFPFLPEMSQRKYLYSFHKIYRKEFQLFTIAPQVKYALIDENDTWLKDSDDEDLRLKRHEIKDFFLKSGWLIKEQHGPITLYQR